MPDDAPHAEVIEKGPGWRFYREKIGGRSPHESYQWVLDAGGIKFVGGPHSLGATETAVGDYVGSPKFTEWEREVLESFISVARARGIEVSRG